MGGRRSAKKVDKTTEEDEKTTTGTSTTVITTTTDGGEIKDQPLIPYIPNAVSPSKSSSDKRKKKGVGAPPTKIKDQGGVPVITSVSPTRSERGMKSILITTEIKDQSAKSGSEKRKKKGGSGRENRSPSKNPEEQGAYAKLKQRIADRKMARETARQQEKNFLEYRKIMILYEYKPTTKALARPADDYFPKRKFSFKDMAFGARKSYFLSLRPNSKFANWHGKKKEQEQMEQEKLLNLKTKAKTMVVATAAAQEQKALNVAQAAQKQANADAADVMDDQIQMLDKVSKESVNYGTEQPLKGDEVKGTRAMMPTAKGADGRNQFFWISGEGEEEVTDEDCPIDSDKVQEVIEGKLKLKVAEYCRRDFNPYDKLDVLRRVNKLCDRETFMMGNTLWSVLKLFDESKYGSDSKKQKKVDKAKENEEAGKPRKLTWLETIEEYNGQGCMARLNGRGVPDAELDKKILPLTLYVRE